MRTIVTGLIAISAVALAIGYAQAASDQPTDSGTKTHHRHAKHAHVRPVPPPGVYGQVPSSAPGCPGLHSWNPNNPDRGYCDPGFAYHGNLNGCVTDLGYGRWEPCDRGMTGGGGGSRF